MARYIDADKLKRILIDSKSFFPVAVKSAIDMTPTEDVVLKSEVTKLERIIRDRQIMLEPDTKALETNLIKRIFSDINYALSKCKTDLFVGYNKFELDTELKEIEKKYIGEKDYGKGN